MEAILFLICMLIMGVAMLVFGNSNTAKAKRLKLIKDMGVYSVEQYGFSIKVVARRREFKDVLKYKKHMVTSLKYNEEKIHIGAATVGGVTTGGIYKTGGDYSDKQFWDGKYELVYRYSDDGKFIKEIPLKSIRLTSDLRKDAEKSSIAKYLKVDKIIVIEENMPSEGTTELLSEMTDRNSTINAMALSQADYERSQGYPTEEKCHDIINWLSNN